MKDNKIPSPLVSLLPVFVLILLLFVTIRTFGSDALSGGSQVCLLVATAVCVLTGMAGFHRPWKDFELACLLYTSLASTEKLSIAPLFINIPPRSEHLNRSEGFSQNKTPES